MTREEKRLAYQKAWREANREKKAAYDKAWREANREKKAAYDKARYEANREKKAAYDKARYEANREKIAARQKAYREANKEKKAASNKAYREANREKIAACNKAWKQTNPDKITAMSSKRRALKLKAIPEHFRECPFEKKRITQIYKLRNLMTKITGIEHHVDHMWPLSKGGPHWSGNLQVIPASENLSKRDKLCRETKGVIKKALSNFVSERSV